MAERRMFSKRIINSARFLKMPVSSQCLYFHLGLHADDDGIVEAYTVMNSVGASEDDLKILVAKGFLLVLNDDLVSYITDWRENNKIRADRKVDSIYKDLLVQMLPDADIQQKKQRADTAKRLLQSPDFENGQPMDVQWTTNGQPMDGIGKDRLGKENINNIYSLEDYEEIWELYPNKKGKSQFLKKIDKLLNTYSKEQITRCIDRYIKDVDVRRKNGFKELKYQNGSTFFNSGYVDYLDENYEDVKPARKIGDRSMF